MFFHWNKKKNNWIDIGKTSLHLSGLGLKTVERLLKTSWTKVQQQFQLPLMAQMCARCCAELLDQHRLARALTNITTKLSTLGLSSRQHPTQCFSWATFSTCAHLLQTPLATSWTCTPETVYNRSTRRDYPTTCPCRRALCGIRDRKRLEVFPTTRPTQTSHRSGFGVKALVCLRTGVSSEGWTVRRDSHCSLQPEAFAMVVIVTFSQKP